MKRVAWCVVVSLIMFGGIVFASETTLSDFQAAVQEADADHGCTSIPYEDLRDHCKESQEQVIDYCKGGHGPWSCQDRPNLDPTSLISKAKGLKAHIEDLKQKKADLEKQKENLSDTLDAATDENERSELQAKIQELEDQIAATEDEIEKKGGREADRVLGEQETRPSAGGGPREGRHREVLELPRPDR